MKDQGVSKEALFDAIAQKNIAYWERNQLVAVLSKVFPSHLARHPENDADWDPEWMWIVFIDTPHGQASWHIHDTELEMFAHLEERPNAWDGHTNDEKYARLAQIAVGWA